MFSSQFINATLINIPMKQGLIALANAASKGWFWGHYGASYLAAQFHLEEIENTVLVEEKTKDVLAKHQDLFTEFDLGPYDAHWQEKILNAIRLNLTRLRAGGHGVIYGAYALKALLKNEDYARENLINGITKLLELAFDDDLRRYYGVDNYDLIEFDDIANFNTIENMLEYSFSELEEVYPNQDIAGKKYFFTGEKIHLVTHAHALVMLNDLGHSELLESGFRNQRQYIKLARQQPPYPKKLELNMTFKSTEYWSRPNLDTHHIKLPYSTLSLLKLYDQEPYKQLALNFLASIPLE